MVSTFVEKIITIDVRDSRLVFLTGGEDRFFMSCEQVARSCKASESVYRFIEDVKMISIGLAKWLENHASMIEDSYLTVTVDGVQLFVVPKNGKYNFDLGDALADLELDLCEKYGSIGISTLQIPGSSPETLATFLNSETALRYGKTERAHEEVGA